MVAPTPKTPRHQLTEQEQRLCREALLSLRHERRIRRAQQKDGGDGDATGKNKKASRKKSAKHTTPAMEGEAAQDGCGAKETADEEEAASVEAAHAEVEEVVAGIVESVATSVGTPLRTFPEAAATRPASF
ncbi:hypothetical protein PF005_g26542 [Phytophthora fragariae]|uniref:Uncharacterized protein n=1 Tax=Phytophthora fragariae TaxID=53985 RepID=A0A6A3VVT8_9STRA|nr:hypothetical protein PF005_g26542 [Phytophthora fragariae]